MIKTIFRRYAYDGNCLPPVRGKPQCGHRIVLDGREYQCVKRGTHEGAHDADTKASDDCLVRW